MNTAATGVAMSSVRRPGIRFTLVSSALAIAYGILTTAKVKPAERSLERCFLCGRALLIRFIISAWYRLADPDYDCIEYLIMDYRWSRMNCVYTEYYQANAAIPDCMIWGFIICRVDDFLSEERRIRFHASSVSTVVQLLDSDPSVATLIMNEGELGTPPRNNRNDTVSHDYLLTEEQIRERQLTIRWSASLEVNSSLGQGLFRSAFLYMVYWRVDIEP